VRRFTKMERCSMFAIEVEKVLKRQEDNFATLKE
jgi:hypothetical protein